MNLAELKKNIFSIYKKEFKKNGFNISGNTFRKKENGFVKVFNIQLSQFNFYISDNLFSCSYCINIGLFYPEAYNFSFSEFYTDDVLEEMVPPKNPKESDCQFSSRGHEILGTLKSYVINNNTDIAIFIELITKEIKNVFIPFFEELVDLEDCKVLLNKYLKSDAVDIWTALAYTSLGKHYLAKELVLDVLKKNEVKPRIKKRIIHWIESKGVDLGVPNDDDEQNKIDISSGRYP
ncbi:hypothetical protein FUAX_54940 (plasmid) [Fulvitalea axinellae]|uniref:DUF4304 domain-containing protein n=1 Tax=Fulvitalea axinellae TaxID=1182444 RepID=A0AAU9CZ80_9BACT|nr:hypothetical protein FUAX_54940 [Fulvitalea axinellae]